MGTKERRERKRQKKFPGFQECMHLMRKSDPQLSEDGFHLLLIHAREYVQQMMDEFNQEANSSLRS